jgi:hypothetical protein
MRRFAAIAITVVAAVCVLAPAPASETPIKIGVVSRTIFYLPTLDGRAAELLQGRRACAHDPDL